LQLITQGVQNSTATFSPYLGDIDKNNLLDIIDYNDFSDCYGMPVTGDCVDADLTDDGLIDGSDYNYFIGNISHRSGD